MKIVILYSGGLDSYLMKKYAEVKYPSAEVKCVYYKHGAPAEDAEVKNLPSYVEVRSVDWLGDAITPVSKKSDPFAGSVYIPGRNAVFSVLAACQELPDEVWLGALADECNEKGTDKNYKFLSLVNSLLSYTLSPFVDRIAVKFPFADNGWTKVDAVKWALENGVEANDLKTTVSCWVQDGDKPCGECKQCVKRFFVFALNGIVEDTAVPVLSSPKSLNLIQSYMDAKGKTDNIDEKNMINMIEKYVDLSGATIYTSSTN